MKAPLPLVVLVTCGLFVANSFGETSAESATASDTPKHPSPSQKSTAQKPSPASYDDAAAEAAKAAHIRPASAPVATKTPPPAPREETKPPAPAQGLVWVPGHWAPAKGEWQWTAGTWSIPATPISVWIEARYDSETREWTPGYWQPDREQPYEEEEAPLIDQSNRVKF